MAAASGATAQVAINFGFEADAAQKLVAAFVATDSDKSGFVENDEVRVHRSCLNLRKAKRLDLMRVV